MIISRLWGKEPSEENVNVIEDGFVIKKVDDVHYVGLCTGHV